MFPKGKPVETSLDAADTSVRATWRTKFDERMVIRNEVGFILCSQYILDSHLPK
jgi:hypothetical protein